MMILLCGMIASGKGRFSDLCADRGDIVVNDDSFVLALHNGRYDRYEKRHKGIYKSAEAAAIIACLQTKTTVVVDRPNFRKLTRARFISLAAAMETPVVCVTFPREDVLTHATRRFDSDARGKTLEFWIEAATHHHAQWEEPALDEGFDNIIPADVAREMVITGKL